MDPSKAEPSNEDELRALYDLLRSDPQEFLTRASSWISQDPSNGGAYFTRHNGWMQVGQPELALSDLNKSIELEPSQMDFLSKGDVLRHLGRYPEAIAAYRQGEAMDPEAWEKDVIGLYCQADTFARLGDERTALAYCSRLPDDFWTPGLQGAPAGTKAEVAHQLRAVAAAAPKNGQ
jgi:tetratricopeptide (TPR) repeat protein